MSIFQHLAKSAKSTIFGHSSFCLEWARGNAKRLEKCHFSHFFSPLALARQSPFGTWASERLVGKALGRLVSSDRLVGKARQAGTQDEEGLWEPSN